MKRSVVLLRLYAGVGSLLLTLALCLLAGCSDSERSEKVVNKLSFDQSEILALKNAGAGRKDLEQAIMKKKIEQMQERGVTVNITPPGKKTRKPR
jgi:hypothetical protein